MAASLEWSGTVRSVQPRIRLTRSFDQRQHTYLGYVLLVEGTLAGEARSFVVAVGKGAHAKHAFRIGDRLRGVGAPVANPDRETAELYRASGLKFDARVVPDDADDAQAGPPFHGLCPPLETYRHRGHRRLAARTWAGACRSCMWGCEMAVDMIVDQWKPDRRRYRRETFCYGPKSCPLYRPGPTRKVPGRRGMSWEEEDWVDEEVTGHRGPDE